MTIEAEDRHVTYYLGEHAYAIPWRYNPFNGSQAPGGERFSIRVSYPDFAPQYDRERGGRDLTLTIERAPPNRTGSIALDGGCHNDGPCMTIQPNEYGHFIHEDLFYLFYINRYSELVFENRNELKSFKRNIVNLFLNFKNQ